MRCFLFVQIIYFTICLTNISEDENVNNNIIIGVLTQPVPWKDIMDPQKYSFIASSYIKYLENSGARVVPVRYDLDEKSLAKLMGKINGLFIPGGAADLVVTPGIKAQKQDIEFEAKMLDSNDKNITKEKTEFAKKSAFLINYAIKMNDQGTYFPVWGTCLGFEILILTISDNNNIFDNFNSTNHSMNLLFSKKEANSKLFKPMSEQMKQYLSHYNIMYFNHNYGIMNSTFLQNSNLDNFFNILSFNEDNNKKGFVSTIEAKKYPIYGVQYHPEKNPYELKDHLEVKHSPGSIQTSHFFADFFIDESKKNFNQFPTEKEERESMINNYYPIFYSDNFESIYIFNSTKPQFEMFRALIRQKKTKSKIQKI